MSTDLQQPISAPETIPSDKFESQGPEVKPTASNWNEEKALKWLQNVSMDFDSLSAEVGPFRRSALHFAAQEGQAPMIRFLLSRGERLERRDTQGKMPLHLACEADRVENVKALIGHCLKNRDELEDEEVFNAKDKALQTPIMSSCIRGHPASLRVFFTPDKAKRTPKVDLWLKDGQGRTALHHAAHNGHTKCAEILLGAIDDPKAYILEKDGQGLTSKDIAVPHRATWKLLDERCNAVTAELDKTFWLTVAAFACIAIGLISGLVLSAFFLE